MLHLNDSHSLRFGELDGTPSPRIEAISAMFSGAPATEADHILGDLRRRAPEDPATYLLRIALAHLKAYEARRARQSIATAASPAT